LRIAAALLLQGALGGALVVVLVLVLIVTVLVVAAAFGGALGSRSGEEATQSILPPGTILAAVGLGFAALGAFYASTGFNFLGILSGAIAYYRGARIFGIVVSVLSLATIFVGYYFGSGANQFDL
jgi:hypothetical protein